MEEGKKFTCTIFHFILRYVQVGYYLFMIPFNPVVDAEGKLQFKENNFHKLICFILHMSSLYFGVTTLWTLIKETSPNIEFDSTVLYNISLFGLLNVAVANFIFNCWFVKTNPHKKLLNETYIYMENHYDSKYTKYLASTFVLLLTLLQVGLTAYPEIIAYVSHIEVKSAVPRSYLQLPDYAPLSVLIVALKIFQAIYFQFIFQITIIIPFDLSNLCMYLIGNRFKELAAIEYSIIASPITKWHHESLERLMEYFMTAKFLSTSLNDAFARNVVIITFSVIPTLGYSLSNMISNMPISLSEYIRTFYIFFAFFVSLFLAANGHSNVQYFARTAFETMWSSGELKVNRNRTEEHTRTLLLTIMQYANTTCVGVGGVPFFTITYKFLGTMTSALITYTIIMFQFGNK